MQSVGKVRRSRRSGEVTSNPFKDIFSEYRTKLDEQHDRRERLIKASRDITRESKRAINAVHRITPSSREKDIKRISQSLLRVRDVMATRVANEVDENNYYRFHRAFTFGMQEYVEARTFLYYIVHHALMSPEQIEKEIKDTCGKKETSALSLDLSDYILGVADLTGELMRQGVSDATSSVQVAIFLSEIEAAMESLSETHRLDAKEMSFKLQVLKRSVSKVERTCYDMAIQDAEVISRQNL
ncbi:unnamed protein product [Agarophyton chilense]